ncbi:MULTISPECIES: methyl-accepting chemotaxis protein [unclassified Corallococcus]|uniref:methyl-accepting chemotaxis protein n=1 Tax=unclassified Corallococcus TaxID=2685029 RepID=UPI001A8C07D9|nr:MULTISPECIES: methyl-accepting chemotaxis protein [unclassified Corallococcus]MBN9684174.1 chemotaxis protein [Corallococcus sp. NCSPR001]WAS84337.1 methyl-accepting chemotaxis protein [Corallococcus sp. NCRR]
MRRSRVFVLDMQTRLTDFRGSRKPLASRLAAVGSVLLMLLAFAPVARAATAAAAQPALDGWRYRWGDSPQGPDGVPVWATEPEDAEGWQAVTALQEPPGRGTNTFLWLSIPLPQGPWLEPALFLGNVANAFELYADGQRVYASGTVDPAGQELMENMVWHLVPVPPASMGHRVLLRIQAHGPAIGVTRAAKVGSHPELLAEVTRVGLAPFVMGTLLVGIGAVALGAALLRRQWRMLAALTVFSAGSGALLLGSSGLFPALWGKAATGSVLTLLGSYAILPALGWFISDTVGTDKLRWFRRGAAVVTVPAILQAILVVIDLGSAWRLLSAFILYSLPGLLVCVGVAVVEALKGNKDARIFVAGLGVLTVVLLLSTLPMLGVMEVTDSQVHWGFFALTLSLVAIVGRRSAEVVRSLAEYTHLLDARRKDVRLLAEGMGRGADELAAVVQQLHTSSEEQTVGISRQAAALRELETTVEEIRQGSHVTADKARALAASAESAEAVGREGGAALERTLTDLAAIRTEVSGMASRILALDERTREVSSIVDDVKTLADQSNMLAINAAIEAVRNGDSGKGFGVVAKEMRRLADQSIRATERIRDVLDGVSMSMREAAQMSEQGEARVQVSLDAVRGSGEKLQKLTSIIGDTTGSVRQITQAVAQQDSGTHQIAQAIQELSGQMQRTLQAVEETRTVTHSVQTLAEVMSGAASKALRSGTLDDQQKPAAA